MNREVRSHRCLLILAKSIIKLPSTLPFIFRPQTNLLLAICNQPYWP